MQQNYQSAILHNLYLFANSIHGEIVDKKICKTMPQINIFFNFYISATPKITCQDDTMTVEVTGPNLLDAYLKGLKNYPGKCVTNEIK